MATEVDGSSRRSRSDWTTIHEDVLPPYASSNLSELHVDDEDDEPESQHDQVAVVWVEALSARRPSATLTKAGQPTHGTRPELVRRRRLGAQHNKEQRHAATSVKPAQAPPPQRSRTIVKVKKEVKLESVVKSSCASASCSRTSSGGSSDSSSRVGTAPPQDEDAGRSAADQQRHVAELGRMTERQLVRLVMRQSAALLGPASTIASGGSSCSRDSKVGTGGDDGATTARPATEVEDEQQPGGEPAVRHCAAPHSSAAVGRRAAIQAKRKKPLPQAPPHRSRLATAVKVKKDVKLESAVKSVAASGSGGGGSGGGGCGGGGVCNSRSRVGTCAGENATHARPASRVGDEQQHGERAGRRLASPHVCASNHDTSSTSSKGKRQKRRAPASRDDAGGQPKRPRQQAVGGDNTWNARYHGLLLFVEAHGHAQVPSKFADDPALGKWVRRQRQAYAAELEREAGQQPRCAHRISAARVKKLHNIGFDWGMKCDDMWDVRFAALRRFVKKHGHTRVSEGFADDPALDNWVKRQRRAYAAEVQREAGQQPSSTFCITAARVKKLQRVGFEFVLKRITWDEHFAALRRFVKKHGHTRVPSYGSDDDPKLGTWVNKQRRAYAEQVRNESRQPICNHRITLARMHKLERIGFEWRVA
jgi:hypothetical protein